MPIPIQNATVWARLQRAFGLLGRHKLLLDEIVVPVALVEDLSGVEVLLEKRYAQGGDTQGAVAGNSTRVQIFNPAGSGILVELYQAVAGASGAGVINWGPVVAVLAGSISGTWQDRRLTPASVPAALIQTDNNPAGPVLVNPLKLNQLGNTAVLFRCDVTLLPGTGFVFEGHTVNTSISAGFWWVESALPE